MEKKRPNVLLICTDQQRFDALGCYGNARIKTPHIDNLAAEGVLFERCYVQSPVCGPSRASLLTGQYVHNHGLWANGVALPEHKRLFTQNLADVGYDCGLIGKSHLAACFQGRTEPRRDDGFRTFKWAHDPSHGSPENHYHRWLEARFPELYARAMENGPGRQGHNTVPFDTMPTEAHYSRWVGEESSRFLREERDPERPFFFMANFFDPHHPFVAPEEYLDRYDPAALPPPIGGPELLADRPPILTEAHHGSYAGHARGFADHSPEEIQNIIAAYYAMVTLIDDEVGRILSTVSELDLEQETLVIFTSDHGEMLGDYGLLLKGPMFYDGAVRVPLILRWPGQLPAGERRSQIVEWLDLGATVLDATATPPLAGDQGISLLPIARGDEEAPSRGWALTEYRNSGHPYDPPVQATMLRQERYKLVVHHGEPATDRKRCGELYDMDADPQELHNLWDDPNHLEIRRELEAALLDTLVATEDRSQPRQAFW